MSKKNSRRAAALSVLMVGLLAVTSVAPVFAEGESTTSESASETQNTEEPSSESSTPTDGSSTVSTTSTDTTPSDQTNEPASDTSGEQGDDGLSDYEKQLIAEREQAAASLAEYQAKEDKTDDDYSYIMSTTVEIARLEMALQNSQTSAERDAKDAANYSALDNADLTDEQKQAILDQYTELNNEGVLIRKDTNEAYMNLVELTVRVDLLKEEIEKTTDEETKEELEKKLEEVEKERDSREEQYEDMKNKEEEIEKKKDELVEEYKPQPASEEDDKKKEEQEIEEAIKEKDEVEIKKDEDKVEVLIETPKGEEEIDLPKDEWEKFIQYEEENHPDEVELIKTELENPSMMSAEDSAVFLEQLEEFLIREDTTPLATTEVETETETETTPVSSVPKTGVAGSGLLAALMSLGAALGLKKRRK